MLKLIRNLQLNSKHASGSLPDAASMLSGNLPASPSNPSGNLAENPFEAFVEALPMPPQTLVEAFPMEALPMTHLNSSGSLSDAPTKPLWKPFRCCFEILLEALHGLVHPFKKAM